MFPTAVSINCPSDISVPNDCNVNNAIVIWKEPSVQGGEGLLQMASSHVSGMKYELGTTTVTYTLSEMSGRVVIDCSFEIIVVGKFNKDVVVCC